MEMIIILTTHKKKKKYSFTVWFVKLFVKLKVVNCENHLEIFWLKVVVFCPSHAEHIKRPISNANIKLLTKFFNAQNWRSVFVETLGISRKAEITCIQNSICVKWINLFYWIGQNIKYIINSASKSKYLKLIMAAAY